MEGINMSHENTPNYLDYVPYPLPNSIEEVLANMSSEERALLKRVFDDALQNLKTPKNTAYLERVLKLPPLKKIEEI
jgi:hypothetical protein